MVQRVYNQFITYLNRTPGPDTGVFGMPVKPPQAKRAKGVLLAAA